MEFVFFVIRGARDTELGDVVNDELASAGFESCFCSGKLTRAQ
jgi:hypothetical protein